MAVELGGVIAGGVIALAGIVAGQVLAHQYTRGREREKLIREKAEALLAASYEAREWISQKQNIMWFGDRRHEGADPAHKVYMLIDLYFGNCRKELAEVLKCAEPLVGFIFSEAGKRVGDGDRSWVGGHGERFEKFTNLYSAYASALAKFQAAVVAETERQLAVQEPLLRRIGNLFRTVLPKRLKG